MCARTISSRTSRGFSLVELMVAMAVLFLLIVIVAQIIDMTTRAISTSNKAQDADGKARLIMDRIGGDLGNMVRRSDLDVIFPKLTGNDEMFFYSEAPAYFDTSNTSLFPGSSSSNPKSNLALIGYHITGAYQMERLGLGLTWDGSPQASSPGAAIYLSYLNGTIDPASTLSGNWPSVIGTAPNYQGTATGNWQELATQVLRLEICFLLKDGTLSVLPILNPAATQNNLTATSAPLLTSDAAAGYSSGSRWFDTSAQRGYICIGNTAGAAVWNVTGTQDIDAIVVAIVVMDDASRKIVPATAIATTANLFPDVTAADLSATPPVLMKSTWQTLVQSSTFAATTGLPPLAASHIRVYQRYFSLHTP